MRTGAQPMELLGLMGAVRVHLADHVIALSEGDPEAVEVRRAEARLLRTVHHRDRRVRCGQPIRDLPGAVR